MKQFAVIGIGNFGYYLATYLYNKGHEVMAVDIDAEKIQSIKDRVSQAIVANAAEREVLVSIGIDKVDRAIVCIGSAMESSILATLNLNDMGVKELTAMAISDTHSRLLYKVGAINVFFPEKDQAIMLGERYHRPNMLEYLPFLDGYSIIELKSPPEFTGRLLKDLNLINEHGIQVIAIKHSDSGDLNMIPTGLYSLSKDDILVVLGPNESLEKLQDEKK